MQAATPTAFDMCPPARLHRAAQEKEIRSLIAFSRGVLVGFTSAFVVFDWALLDLRTSRGVAQGLQHVALMVL